MFDKKIEPIAMKYIRAALTLKEAEDALALANSDLRKVLKEGTNYMTKDGDVITVVKSSVRKQWLVDICKKRFAPRIWKAVRIDAIDTKKLGGFIAAGEVDPKAFADCFDTIPVKSSIRVAWAATTTNSKQVA